MVSRRGNPGLKGRLLGKSIDAYVLALETVNSLSIKYRIEAFTYLLCNAWELLLKAKIIKDTGKPKSIYYRTNKNELPRSLSLRNCIDSIFTKSHDPVRLNLEKVIDLRDQACHLVISNVPKEVLGLFQSCVLNYHKKLQEWFNRSLSDRVSVGMMTIVYDFKPEEFDLRNPRLKREMGRDTADFLMKFQAELAKQDVALGKVPEFCIDISYTLALVKKTSDGDICLTSGPTGSKAQVVKVARDASETHPYRQKDVIAKVNDAVQPRQVNAHDLQCIRRAHNIEKRSDFFYQGSVEGNPKQYSNTYVTWLIDQINTTPDFLEHARATYRAQRNRGEIPGELL